MNQAKVVDVLEHARELIKIGWIRGNWAKNKKGVSVDPWSEDACEWCIEGAILAKTHYDEEDKVLADACVRILQVANKEFTDMASLTKINNGNNTTTHISGHSVIPEVNDHKATHKDVIRMFNNAIRLAKGARWS